VPRHARSRARTRCACWRAACADGGKQGLEYPKDFVAVSTLFEGVPWVFDGDTSDGHGGKLFQMCLQALKDKRVPDDFPLDEMPVVARSATPLDAKVMLDYVLSNPREFAKFAVSWIGSDGTAKKRQAQNKKLAAVSAFKMVFAHEEMAQWAFDGKELDGECFAADMQRAMAAYARSRACLAFFFSFSLCVYLGGSCMRLHGQWGRRTSSAG